MSRKFLSVPTFDVLKNQVVFLLRNTYYQKPDKKPNEYAKINLVQKWW